MKISKTLGRIIIIGVLGVLLVVVVSVARGIIGSAPTPAAADAATSGLPQTGATLGLAAETEAAETAAALSAQLGLANTPTAPGQPAVNTATAGPALAAADTDTPVPTSAAQPTATVTPTPTTTNAPTATATLGLIQQLTGTAAAQAPAASLLTPSARPTTTFNVPPGYLDVVKSQTGDLPAPANPVLQNSQDGHYLAAVGTLYDLPQCWQVPAIEDYCARKTWRKFLLDDGYLGGPGAGILHAQTFADVKSYLLAHGYRGDQIVKVLHSPFLAGTGFNPLHPGEGRVKINDLDKLSSLGFVFTFAYDDTIPLWDPAKNYKAP